MDIQQSGAKDGLDWYGGERERENQVHDLLLLLLTTSYSSLFLVSRVQDYVGVTTSYSSLLRPNALSVDLIHIVMPHMSVS